MTWKSIIELSICKTLVVWPRRIVRKNGDGFDGCNWLVDCCWSVCEGIPPEKIINGSPLNDPSCSKNLDIRKEKTNLRFLRGFHCTPHDFVNCWIFRCFIFSNSCWTKEEKCVGILKWVDEEKTKSHYYVDN